MRVREEVVTGVMLALWHSREGGRGATGVDQVAKGAGVSVVEVHEALGELERRGCRVERSPGGVRLVEASLSCWRDVVEDRAKREGRSVGRIAVVFSRTTSTNDVAWERAGEGEKAHGLVVLADEQSAGRGRPGHAWSARAGQSVLMSVVVGGVRAGELNRLTLLAGLAVARAVEGCLGRAGAVEIKWPNDILIEGRKVAGVLVERRAGGDGAAAVVIGIGVNVEQGLEDFGEGIRERATSVRMSAGVAVDRLEVAVRLLDALAEWCFVPVEGEGWIREWKERCGLLGRLVTARDGGVTVTGHVVDISPLQGLVLKDAGGVNHFLSAQTSSLL